MLSLLDAFPASPSTRIQYFFHDGQHVGAYGTSTSVVLLSARNHALLKVLAFDDLYPREHISITCLSVDAKRVIVAAASGNRIVLWSPSRVDPRAWRVHSTLAAEQAVTALHCCNGFLVVGSSRGLYLYSLLEADLPTWIQRWSKATPASTSVCISPSALFVASASSLDKSVRIFSASNGRQTQSIRHPLLIHSISWRDSSNSHVLYTTTTDDTLRIFMPVLDSPNYFQLHDALDRGSFRIDDTANASFITPLDVFTLGNILPPNAAEIHGALDDGHDLFARICSDKTVSIRAVMSIDSKPPTLLQQYSLLSRSALPYIAELHPSPVISSGDPRKIISFVRTPAGHGVAVVREGGGDVWMRTPTSLVRTRSWDGAQVVAVVDSGRRLATFHDSPPRVLLDDLCVMLPEGTQLSQLFALLSTPGYTSLIGVTATGEVLQIRITPALSAPGPHVLTLHSVPARLGNIELPRLILPVDPMVANTPRDVLLSISEEGELVFWSWSDKEARWLASSGVRTGRSNVRIARCSSMRKTVLVVPSDDGMREELTIWDSKVSEFSYGLEYRHMFEPEETIKDLDWTSNASTSILAVGFARRVLLLCPQRMTYFEQEPAWHVVGEIDISHISPYPIADSIWMAGRAFLIGSGADLLLYGQSDDHKETLFDVVANENGPLDDYHPQMLLQCLLWGKIGLVKTIITRLASALENGTEYERLPLEDFIQPEPSRLHSQIVTSPRQYSFLFNRSNGSDDEDEQGFSRALVDRLLMRLNQSPPPSTLTRLSINEQRHLAVSIQTTLEIDEQRRALDASGLRFLISMRSFYILNAREDSGDQTRQRIRYRDMVWAFHSESKDLLLAAATHACGGKMLWNDAKAVGVFLWLTSSGVKDQMEVIARNQYMAGDARDPTACCLFYFALGKARLVHGLWKQAAWHKEQAIMLKFLANDFTTERWRTAALKNAYALLGKQRYEYAAAFFLLGGSLKDAVNILVNQVGDVQLAIAVSRVYEGNDEGPVLTWLLNDVVVPLAFREGNRWLGSWAFWMLHRRDLAVRILINPLDEFARSVQLSNVTDIGDPHYDDPSLALMFRELKSKSLQTAKGSSEIPGQTEFNFVLHTASVFRRMGCHTLALDLVQNWHFDRPTVKRPTNGVHRAFAHSPHVDLQRQSSVFAIHPRRLNLSIDMDIPTIPPTRAATPETVPVETDSGLSADSQPGNAARVAGLGSLMKTAKQDVSVPEFSLDAFF